MADDYWIDIVPSRLQISGGKRKSQVGADDYIINPGKVGDYSVRTTVGDRAFSAVGADDYILEKVGADDYVISNVGATHKAVNRSRRRIGGRARGGFQDDYFNDWPIYVVRNDDVVSPEDNVEPQSPIARTDVPDEVSGPHRHRGRRYGRYPTPQYWPAQPYEIVLDETEEVGGFDNVKAIPQQIGMPDISKYPKFKAKINTVDYNGWVWLLAMDLNGQINIFKSLFRDSERKEMPNELASSIKANLTPIETIVKKYPKFNAKVKGMQAKDWAWLMGHDWGGRINVLRGVFQDTEKKEMPIQLEAFWHAKLKPPKALNPFTAIAHAAGDVIHVVNAGVNLVAKGLSHIPVVGGALSTALRVTTSGPAAIERISKGQRIDKAFIQLGKDELKNIKEVAPYVQQVMAFIPGVGTGVAAAIAAGTALAEGKTITEALLSAAKGAIPGGALAGGAFDAALKVVKPGVSAAVVEAARNALPPQAQKAFDIGSAYAHARNVQSAVVTAATKPAGIAAMQKAGQALAKAAPHVAQATKGLSSEATKGFHAAAGILAHSDQNAHAAIAMRSKLPPAQQAGFDHAAKILLAKVTPNWPSMVVNGIVTRGEYKPCRPGAKGCVTGYHVSNGKVTKGTFSRA